MPAAVVHQALDDREIDAWLLRGSPVRASWGCVASPRTLGLCHRDERMHAHSHIGMLGDEMSIDDDGAELDLQATAGWHGLPPIAGEIHQQPLYPFGREVDHQR